MMKVLKGLPTLLYIGYFEIRVLLDIGEARDAYIMTWDYLIWIPLILGIPILIGYIWGRRP